MGLAEIQQQNVLVEQVRILYRTMWPILAANLIVGSAMVFGLWDVVSQTTLIAWMASMLLLLLVRGITYATYRRRFSPESAHRYGRYFVIGAGLTGLLWGIGAVVLFPHEALEFQLFILFVLVGMGAGAVSSLTIYLPAFYAYLPISLIPIAINLGTLEEAIHLSLAGMTFAYLIALSYLGLNINRALVESLKLRFENSDLVEQLRKQKDEAEQANISKTKFLAAASHDLRQPLHALTLFTSVLDDSIKYPKARRVVDQIKSSVDALQSLFNALLDISRLEAGVLKVEKTDFALRPVFQKLANDFNPQALEKGLTIIWPECDHAVHSDANLLEQVLRNYIGNAIRYTDSGEVRIGCEGDGAVVSIDVADTGIGIPDEEREAIFKEFHQLSNPERDRSKGLGLGLAIVQRTAKLLGHLIEVESQVGKGSVFSICVDQAVLAQNTQSQGAAEEMNEDNADTALFVVIDDEASIREGMESLLQSWGSRVITAAGMAQAMEALAQQDCSPDAIIADYRLRESQTGIEAIHAIQAKYEAGIPALIVTGDTAAELLREVNESGFQVLHKPVAPAKLRAFLRHVQLRKNRQARVTV